MENTITILETECKHAEQHLLKDIQSLRNKLDNIEQRIKDGSPLYISDGIQHSGWAVDIGLTRIVTYRRALEAMYRME